MTRWKTLVYAAGREFTCRDSYDEIKGYLTESCMTISESEVHWIAPLQLRCKAEEGTASLLVQPHAISAVVDIEPEESGGMPMSPHRK